MSEEKTVHASESGHWYYRSGMPCFQVQSADKKKLVDCDLRHARKLGLVPGVTSIIGCAAKPALTEWKVMQGILSSLTLPRRPHEPEAEFIKRVVADSQEQARKAAERGTAIHAAIQAHYDSKPVADEFVPYVAGAVACIEKHFGADTQWDAEYAFACHMGFGSKIDLRARNRRIIVDIKGKEFADAPSAENKLKFHWDEHAMQLGAYDAAMHLRDGGPPHACANLFVSRNVPGLCHMHVWGPADVTRGWEQFEALLRFWQVSKKYDSSFELLAAA